jgi:oxalate decarboxylase
MDSDIKTFRHVVSLIDQEPGFVSVLGSIVRTENRQFPLLRHLSISRLILSPGSVQESRWHTNAHELGYCVMGDALLTIVGDHGIRNTFTIEAGDMFFLPAGTVHNIENIGEGTLHTLIVSDEGDPGDSRYRAAAASFSREIIAFELGIPEYSLPKIPVDTRDPLIIRRIKRRVAQPVRFPFLKSVHSNQGE